MPLVYALPRTRRVSAVQSSAEHLSGYRRLLLVKTTDSEWVVMHKRAHRHLQALSRRRLIRVLVLFWQRYADGHQRVLQRNEHSVHMMPAGDVRLQRHVVSRLQPGNASTTLTLRTDSTESLDFEAERLRVRRTPRQKALTRTCTDLCLVCGVALVELQFHVVAFLDSRHDALADVLNVQVEQRPGSTRDREHLL